MSTRRISSVAHVGNIAIGGDNPIRIQSMATVDTNDTEGCVAQAKRIIDAGGELVRFTTQGTREAENMKNISARLKADGYNQPLVADVHFTAHTADVAAQYCEKVRINPGNYVDPGRTFKHLEYTDEEYAAELEKIEKKLVPFINICKEHHTAVRIGVNHGSLSDRIMSRYGDTPEGIVESCMEFLRIFRRENFNDVVISIKASNTVVMVTTVRLLVKKMDQEDMHYPLHLGVTEAGEGEDGRIKSAVGIGALLTEGIGDTIRVSLSEEPECEIPVARKLVELYPSKRRGVKSTCILMMIHYISILMLQIGKPYNSRLPWQQVLSLLTARLRTLRFMRKTILPAFWRGWRRLSSRLPASSLPRQSISRALAVAARCITYRRPSPKSRRLPVIW